VQIDPVSEEIGLGLDVWFKFFCVLGFSYLRVGLLVLCLFFSVFFVSFQWTVPLQVTAWKDSSPKDLLDLCIERDVKLLTHSLTLPN